MNIKRINIYNDNRFSKRILNQHGCLLVDGKPYEVEIISDTEAIIHGETLSNYDELIDEFRFYTPHIYVFYDENHNKIKEFQKQEVVNINIDDIQPSQFYVDIDKVNAIKTFINCPDDIIIQVKKYNDRYISLDGHTRLYYAVQSGYKYIRAVFAETDDYIYDFVDEAIKRNVKSPKDLELLSHQDYIEKWDKFCDDFFADKE